MMKEAVIIGNSEIDLDLDTIDRDTCDLIGMGTDFNLWDTINRCPDIYINTDHESCQTPEVIEFVKKDKCSYYILSKFMLEKEKELNREKVFFIEDLVQFPQCSFRLVRSWCDETAAIVACLDRYKKISILDMPGVGKPEHGSWKELGHIIEFINSMYPEHQIELTNYHSDGFLSHYFKTKFLTEFNIA
tara:strand:- start:1867 stop:2433 length:567 start_codon:yes stop_codon:yes gene_type:complete